MSSDPLHLPNRQLEPDLGSADARPGTSGVQAGGTQESERFDAMRREVEELAARVGEIAARRADAVRDAAEETTQEVRTVIRRQPLISLAVAGAVGAALGMAVSRPSTSSRRLRNHDAFRNLEAMTRRLPENLDAASARVRSSVGRYSLADRLEQVADAVSRIDPSALANPIADAAQRLTKALIR